MKPYGVTERINWLKDLCVWRTRKEKHRLRRTFKRLERQKVALELKQYTS